jgi:hypothetical protein
MTDRFAHTFYSDAAVSPQQRMADLSGRHDPLKP